jgi:LmbE family N-acetylglucosaminyl deacetylase
MTRYFSKGLLGAALIAAVAPAFAGGLLVVAPHPDDDLLIAAGVIASAKARGEQVKVVFMTNGDFNGPAEGAIRQVEAVNAQIENLGTTEDDLIFLGYPDGSLLGLLDVYTSADDQFFAPSGQSVTYGAHGLGRADYHSHRFGAPAAYNGANVIADLQDVITTYLPDHILTTSEFDQHLDHSSTYALVNLAINATVATHPAYHPTLHKTAVWSSDPGESPVWPATMNPATNHEFMPVLDITTLSWEDRESLDVPLAMQSTQWDTNLKYKAIDRHVSQGGAASFLGRFLHKDEIFWAEAASGSLPPHVDAGAGLSVAAGATASLNGAGSASKNGASLTYQWRQTIGTPVTLSSSTVATPTFTAPSGLTSDTVLGFELKVSDGQKTSLADSVLVTVQVDIANSRNLAPQASVTASSQNTADGQVATKAVDGVADGYPGDSSREWSTTGERSGAWIQLQWSSAVLVNKVVLFDRPNGNDFITGGVLTFSDGSSVPVSALNNDGQGFEVRFSARNITSVRFTATSTSGASENVGLAEFQVFGAGDVAQSNLAPTANAGPAQTVASGATVQLNASASSDPEGHALGYQWHQLSGNTVALSSATSANPTFVAPAGLAQDAVLSFEVVVNDGVNNSAPATVNVTVVAPHQASENVAPYATVSASAQNTADGQFASSAVDGVIDGYPGNYLREWAAPNQGTGAWIELQWTTPVVIDRAVLFDRPNGDDQITGATLTFSDGSSVSVGALDNAGGATSVSFSARAVTSMRLTVTSVKGTTLNVGLAELQVFTVGAAPVNQAPIARAGTAQTVAQGDLVQIDGLASSDPEGAQLTYRWHQVGGQSVALSSTSEAAPLFVAPSGLTQNAVLSFELVVNDGQVDSLPVTATVTVLGTAAINIAPQASVLVSSENAADSQLGVKAVDGVISGYPGDYTREWATSGQRTGAWIELRWTTPMVISKVVLYDRPNSNDQITAAELAFSDGTTESVPALNNNGTATIVNIPPKTVISIRLTTTSVAAATVNVGLSEFEVFGSPAP